MNEEIPEKRQRALDPKLLSAAIDYLPLPIFIKDENSQFVFSNRRHDEIVGKPESELLGQTTAFIFSQEEADKSRERDLPVLEEGTESIVQREHTYRDGGTYFSETRKTRLVDEAGRRYVLGVNFDLTQQRQRESHLRAVTTHVPVGLIEVAEGQGAVYVNDLALGYLQMQGLQDPLPAVLAALSQGREDFPGKRQRFEVSFGQNPETCKRLLVRSSGWIDIPYQSERAAIISLVDLSEVGELRRENDEINRLNMELEDKLAKLREAQDQLVEKGKLEQLGQLTATIAHELRNPLGAVSTSSFLLQRKLQEQNPGTEKLFARVANGVKRCDNIITQLLDFARSRKLELEEVALDDWMAALVSEECQKLSVSIQVFLDLGLGDAKIAMDAARMSRAVINVVHNAAEAMVGKTDYEVNKGINDPTIRIATRVTGRGCEIVVTDNGPGMEPEIVKRVREPLFTTKNFGTGLGVPAVEKILEQHQGGLDIDSTPGKGSTFTMWWPGSNRVDAA